MKAFIKNFGTNNIKSRGAKLLLFMFTMVSCLPAMAADSKELLEAQEKAERHNILSNIFMVVGFIAVIAIAWFFRKTNDTEVHEHHPPQHPNSHHHKPNDKKYGTHHANHPH